MVDFVAIVEGSAAGKMWGVRFPDVPGCVSQAETLDQALFQATAALREVMAYKRDGGVELPKARDLAEVIAAGEVGPGETAIIIPLALDSD